MCWPDRVVDRTQRGPIAITANGFVTLEPQLVLPGRFSTDQRLVIAPPRLTVPESQTLDVDFLAVSQPAGAPLQVVAAANGITATAFAKGNDVYTLRRAAGGNSVGEYTVLLTVTSNSGAKFTQSSAVRVRRLSTQPTGNDQSVVTAAGVARNITLTGSNLSGRAITLLLLSLPSGGDISGALPNLIYTPRAGFGGLDVFQFRANVNNSSVVGEPSVIYVIVR